MLLTIGIGVALFWCGGEIIAGMQYSATLEAATEAGANSVEYAMAAAYQGAVTPLESAGIYAGAGATAGAAGAGMGGGN